MSIVNVVAAIASCVSATGVYFLWRQVKADHERTRREKAIELMQFFVEQTNSDYSLRGAILRRFARSLDREQCELMLNSQPMKVDGKFAEFLRPFLIDLMGEAELAEHNGYLLLTSDQVAILKGIVYNYLNVLEAVAAAWRHNIADREIIEEEFLNVLSPRRGIFEFHEFRLAAGIFPSISALSNALESRQATAKGKRPIL